jgi:predicted site-specific integrase-resolvase
MEKVFINQIELSRRWSISPRTLERWRWLGEGPAFVKLGGRVVYRMKEIEQFEEAQARTSTTDQGQALAARGVA